MEKPSVAKSFLEKFKQVRDDIELVWNDMLERFQVIHTHKKTRDKRIILTVENDDQGFRHPDIRTILYLANIVAWECLDAYPDPKDLYEIMGKFGRVRMGKQRKKELIRREYLKWWNKEHKKQWREALENARRGIFSIPRERERKIYVGGTL